MIQYLYVLWNNHNKSSYHPITIQSYNLFFSTVCDENFSYLFSWQLSSILFTLKPLPSGKNHHYVLCICEFSLFIWFGFRIHIRAYLILLHSLYCSFWTLFFLQTEALGQPYKFRSSPLASRNSLLTALLFHPSFLQSVFHIAAKLIFSRHSQLTLFIA